MRQNSISDTWEKYLLIRKAKARAIVCNFLKSTFRKLDIRNNDEETSTCMRGILKQFQRNLCGNDDTENI